MFQREWLRLYFIFGEAYIEEASLPIIEAALKSGVTMFQLREKGPFALKGTALIEYGYKVKALCRQYRVPFVVNDDLELAMALGADGVHLGQDDVSIEQARAVLPKEMFIGISATNLEEAIIAKKRGADYIGVGPIYPTLTKADAKIPIGFSRLKAIKDHVGDTPIVAIGGLRARDMPRLKKYHIDGAAVISEIGYQQDVSASVISFLSSYN
ncbi:thiamine-phosphate synthase 1 [Halolactibacillus miurensis]|uniref:Thiamine-phosphate synthase n=1 Tax=Halolactibacillus miurensis TaxID=306541 RepID=A0A1I6UK90_9BACI|nr:MULTISPECIES: thiamine phosphate synthase [Halolactibacillus]GEM05719.1 thiamine-phosphate synthase 1 [Halolactibacillus miurensis]SFT01843.1 thiamine-phosphate pyrophosphorylase [Halolactibacillus miurensis]